MPSNADIEMRWVDAWSDLIDIVGAEEQWHIRCLLPDGTVVDLESCQGWLQESAYAGYCLNVESGWVNGKRGVAVSRFQP